MKKFNKFNDVYNNLINQWEEYVDQNGYAHDDEGHTYWAGKQYSGGTYGLHDRYRGYGRYRYGSNNYSWAKKSLLSDISKRAAAAEDPNAPKCPKCGASMKMRKGKFGNFWGCSKYPNCNGVKRIATTNRTYGAPINNNDETTTPITSTQSTTTPPPSNTSTPTSTTNIEDVKCPKCGAPMKKRQGKYGAFYGCTKYPNCNGIIKIK